MAYHAPEAIVFVERQLRVNVSFHHVDGNRFAGSAPEELAVAATSEALKTKSNLVLFGCAVRLFERLMMKLRAFVLILAGLAVDAAVAAEPATAYKLVVNSTNAVTTLSHDDVSKIFLKKTTKWPNGQPVLPVDLPATAPVRLAFSKDILRRVPYEVAAYWNQAIFSGRALPPPTKASDSDVLSYVRDNPNAIGYVAADAKIGESVVVLTLRP